MWAGKDEKKNDAINGPGSINSSVVLLIKSDGFIRSPKSPAATTPLSAFWTPLCGGEEDKKIIIIAKRKKESGAQSVAHADMFCVVTGGHYVRHYWACSVPAGGPLGGVVISSQSRFTRRVPPKESMLRHIRKSPRLIKPLIFCDASTPLNAAQRTAAPGHGLCVLWPASTNT